MHVPEKLLATGATRRLGNGMKPRSTKPTATYEGGTKTITRSCHACRNIRGPKQLDASTQLLINLFPRLPRHLAAAARFSASFPKHFCAGARGLSDCYKYLLDAVDFSCAVLAIDIEVP